MQWVRAVLLWVWYLGVVTFCTLVVFSVAHLPVDVGSALVIALLSGAMGLVVIPFFKNG